MHYLLVILGPLLFIIGSLSSGDMPMILGLTAWMLIWWIFSVVPMGVTALLPMIVLPLVGFKPIAEVAANYSNSVVYLFLGGFMLAAGLEKSGLSHRFSLFALKLCGRSSHQILISILFVTAFLSMWISNTATAVMMLPIVRSILQFLKSYSNQSGKDLGVYGIVLYLAVAYGANIGGIMTPVGTPPNVVFIGYLESIYHQHIDFWQWMLIFVPVGIALLIILYFLLVRIFSFQVPIDEPFKLYLQSQYSELGALNFEQKVTLWIFIMTCLLWIFKSLINSILVGIELNDTGIALFGGLSLFLISHFFDSSKRVLNSDDISHLPWDIILLFGGGIALADSLEKVGAIEFVSLSIQNLDIQSSYILVAVFTLIALSLTEIMSNVALCVVALPIVMKLGFELGLPPSYMGLPVAIASSLAFSLPIATPPNAIVFATKELELKHMLKAGFFMNLISLLIIMTLGWFMMRWLL